MTMSKPELSHVHSILLDGVWTPVRPGTLREEEGELRFSDTTHGAHLEVRVPAEKVTGFLVDTRIADQEKRAVEQKKAAEEAAEAKKLADLEAAKKLLAEHEAPAPTTPPAA
jgi:hypothetical protein